MASTSPPPAIQPTPHAAPRPQDEPREITIVSHSNLYYWWPVWVFGFIMAIVTYFEGYVMAVVPYVPDKTGVAVDANATIEVPVRGANGEPEKNDKGEVIMHQPSELKDQLIVYAPQSADKAHVGVPVKDNKEGEPPYLRVSPHKGVGVVFVFVLLMVVFITNVPLRGMWSVLVIVVAVALVVFFILLGWIETILHLLYLLDIRINMGGYITISLFLLLIWLVALLIFDKQRYITVTPGQLSVCEEIGGGQQCYSTNGMTLQKQRSDFFRHYVLGLGSGDLIIRTSGAQRTEIDLPNVLFINAKVRQIENLLKTTNVIETK